jgi:ABC-2 type transport system ATP-binding protein
MLCHVQIASLVRNLEGRPTRSGSGSGRRKAPELARLVTPRLYYRQVPIVSIKGVGKTYKNDFHALKSVDLEIEKGEIFALLGPNGAGKTTLINIICGIVNMSRGTIIADGHDIVKDFRAARSKIGLVPQELSTDAFETVWAAVTFSRGLFGKKANPAYVEKVLRQLSLWDKKDSKIMTLSGGMKRRVLIAKALSHEPSILFLDEPTAGVDVELRHDMWKMVKEMRDRGVTIILTTHYIEEAELMADRIGVINKGELIIVEDKTTLMQRLGKRQLEIVLREPIEKVPDELKDVTASKDNTVLTYTFDVQNSDGIAPLLAQLSKLGLEIKDLRSKESSLEDIFVTLVHGEKS